MKHTRLALALSLTTLLATPVVAASVTMLQFGSFETKAEAEKRLAEIGKKHAASMGKLGGSVREVKLPPDNLTVYRTQAGPVASRTEAQSICAKLVSAGDECYIVQTAMAAGEAKPMVAAMTPAAEPAPAAPAPQTQSEASANGSEATDLTSRLSTLNEPAPRDSASQSMLESVKADAKETTDATTSKMHSVLDEAVSKEDESVASVAEATAATPVSKPKRSFWSRLNPFSSDEPADEPVKKEVAKAPLAIAAPVEEVTSAAVSEPVETVVAAAEKPVARALPNVEKLAESEAPAMIEPVAEKPVEMAATAPAAAAPVLPAPAFDATPVLTQAAPMVLPPPPAPLKAEDRALLAAEAAASKQPITTGEIEKPEVVAAAPVGAPTDGVVSVEEAKRVPLTENEVPAAPAVLAAPEPAKVQPMQPPVSLVPSSTNGIKSQWAQIGPFPDAQRALEFWGVYRQAHPDFPVVRVRVTSPLQYQQKGVNQSWLRVGPVARSAFIKNLCDSIPKQENLPKAKQLRCGSVTDIGASASAKQISVSPLAAPRYKKR